MRRSTLWSEPRSSIGLAVLQHGFTRAPEALGGVAQGLAQEGIATARPHLASLTWSEGFHDREHVARIGHEVNARAEGRPLIGIGHSAGAAAVVHMAAQTGAFAGLLLVDGVDSARGLIARALPALEGLPILLVTADPSACNRQGGLAHELARHRHGVIGVHIVGAGHGDIERIGREGPSRAIYRYACGDRSHQNQVDLLERLIICWSRALCLGRVGPGELPDEPDVATLSDRGLVVLLPT